MIELVKKENLRNYSDEDYVWYACYGSNINYDRFMYYINGDISGKYSSKNGCTNKTRPIEERKFIFECPIYFAGKSKRWGGGMAFLDYESSGNAYGKIYKITMQQFKEVLAQEQKCKLYNAILLVDYIDDLPVFTFTSEKKLNSILNQPSDFYKQVIKEGILNLYDNLNSDQIDQYLKNK